MARPTARRHSHLLRRHDACARLHRIPHASRARVADVRFVYSPLDALKLAKENPSKEVIFFGIGFETTAPSTAATLEAARVGNVANFSVFSNHVAIEPPLQALINGGDTNVDGFIAPGHVATIVGTKAFDFLPTQHNKPTVIAGFEPLDILQAVDMLLTQFLGTRLLRQTRPRGKPIRARGFRTRQCCGFETHVACL